MTGLHLFVSSYSQSDSFGKLIFWALLLLSALTWALIIYKSREMRAARKAKEWLTKQWSTLSLRVLSIEIPTKKNPYTSLYQSIQKESISILKKNESKGKRSLTKADIDSVAHQTAAVISDETHKLSKYLFILGVVVALAPFMGLLGTVWGILLSLSELQVSSGSMRETVLSGLATALGTTVLGLIVAIPALIAHSFLSDGVRDMEHDLEQSWTRLISLLELQYRAETPHAMA